MVVVSVLALLTRRALTCWGCSFTVVRSTVEVLMVVVQSKWKKVECREEGDSVLNLSALSLVSGDASQCLTYLWNFDLRIFFFFHFLSTLWVS